MSDLRQLFTPTTNKPRFDVYVNSLTAKNVTAQQNMLINSLEVKNNLLVDGYTNSHSNQENCGTVLLTLSYPQAVALPAGTGGSNVTFSASLGKVVLSNQAGVNSSCASTDGTTYVQLTTPFNNSTIAWSPTLGLFSGIDGGGTAVYTSPTAVNGTWVIGTPVGVAFNASSMVWDSIYGKFFVGNASPTSTVYASSNGSLYTGLTASRGFGGFAHAPASSGLGTGNGRIVTVGSQGPMYSDDGLIFNNVSSAVSMADVCYSSFWGKFTAAPRNGTLTTAYESVDGITWTAIPNAFDAAVGNLRSILWIDQLQCYITQGDTNIYTSKDGVSWRKNFNAYPAASDCYGALYVSEWGMLISNSIGASAAVSPRRYAL